MTQKKREADSGKAIGETTALRWEPTHVTKPNPRVVPLQRRHWRRWYRWGRYIWYGQRKGISY